MALFKIAPSSCFTCREKHYEQGQDVPCDREDKICGYTGARIDDEEYFMDLSGIASFATYTWEEIASVSRKEFMSKESGKEKKHAYLPTLEKLEECFKYKDWDAVPYRMEDVFYLICLFHRTYIGIMKNAHI